MAAATQTNWADGPYALLEIPAKAHEPNPSPAVLAAEEMAHVHNCLLRCLNSIMLQAPYIPVNGEPGYNRTDVSDLLRFTQAWCEAIHHHHDTEEEFIFPKIEAIAHSPGMLAGMQKEHAAFHEGLENLAAYSKGTKPEEFKWEGETGMKAIILGFADPMVDHLHHEIQMFLSLERLDQKELKVCMDAGTKQATGGGPPGMMYDMVPLIIGGADKTYDGGNSWPPFPFFMPYLIHYWFSRRLAGAWRFLPGDAWGYPVPPHFLPARKAQ